MYFSEASAVAQRFSRVRRLGTGLIKRPPAWRRAAPRWSRRSHLTRQGRHSCRCNSASIVPRYRRRSDRPRAPAPCGQSARRAIKIVPLPQKGSSKGRCGVFDWTSSPRRACMRHREDRWPARLCVAEDCVRRGRRHRRRPISPSPRSRAGCPILGPSRSGRLELNQTARCQQTRTRVEKGRSHSRSGVRQLRRTSCARAATGPDRHHLRPQDARASRQAPPCI